MATHPLKRNVNPSPPADNVEYDSVSNSDLNDDAGECIFFVDVRHNIIFR